LSKTFPVVVAAAIALHLYMELGLAELIERKTALKAHLSRVFRA